MDYSQEALAEAKRQIASVLHKTKEVEKSLTSKDDPNRYKSQITLAQRRIEAFEVALTLIDKELSGC